MNFFRDAWANFSKNPALENTAIDGTFSAKLGTNAAIDGTFCAKASHTVNAKPFPLYTIGVQKLTSVVRAFFIDWVHFSRRWVNSLRKSFCFFFSE